MTKFLDGQCPACRGSLQFPAEAVGTTADCPHCGKPTELMLAAPPQERTVPVRTIIATLITILILIGGLVAVIIALKRAESAARRNPPQTIPPTSSPAK